MQMTRNERNVLASLMGRAVHQVYYKAKYVTIEKLRYVDCGTFTFTARVVFQNKVRKLVVLSSQLYETELCNFAWSRGIRVAPTAKFAQESFLVYRGDFGNV